MPMGYSPQTDLVYSRPESLYGSGGREARIEEGRVLPRRRVQSRQDGSGRLHGEMVAWYL